MNACCAEKNGYGTRATVGGQLNGAFDRGTLHTGEHTDHLTGTPSMLAAQPSTLQLASSTAHDPTDDITGPVSDQFLHHPTTSLYYIRTPTQKRRLSVPGGREAPLSGTNLRVEEHGISLEGRWDGHHRGHGIVAVLHNWDLLLQDHKHLTMFSMHKEDRQYERLFFTSFTGGY
jgi:hypothetical protein